MMTRPIAQRCQWIEAEKAHYGEADKCGAPVVAGRCYCRKHLARAYILPKALAAKLKREAA